MCPTDLSELPDKCERCGKFERILPSGICNRCMSEIEKIRLDPAARMARLRQLNLIENGIIRATRQKMLLDTSQSHTSTPITFGKIIKERETRKTIQVALRARADALYAAIPAVITESRSNDCIQPELLAVNREFMEWLATHPEYMRELPPRKFEEVIAAILEDLGHTVEITPQTRDGGYDIIACLKTALGEILTIVECKRWLPPARVDLAVIERFLYTVREKTRANRGMIATTTQFSIDARKAANEYKFQLRLADFGAIKEMAKQFGSWKRCDDTMLWVPNYAALDPLPPKPDH